MTPTVYLLSLGCSKNLVDSEVMLGVLDRAGYRFTARAGDADVIIINTCAFIDTAVAEASAAIRELGRYKQAGRCTKLVVCGCLPQRFQTSLADQFPDVDLFLGTGEFQRIDRHLAGIKRGRASVYCSRSTYLMNKSTPRILATPPGSAYLKIAEGCSNFCTYCTIPSIRGPYRIRPQGSVIGEARRLVMQYGVRELNVIAQDTTAYPGFATLLRKLAKIAGLRWIRVLYGHPAHLTLEVLRVLADEETVCKYLDLPLQHISDSVLRRMGRRMTGARIRALLETARRIVPGISLRTTLMVGFPGETDREFKELLGFVREFQFDYLGVFAYRDEQGTPALRMEPKVPEQVKRERVRALMHEQAEISRRNNRRHCGRVYEVLVEGPADRQNYVMQGRTSFQAPEVDGMVFLSKPAPAGEIIGVRICRTLTYDLVGVPLSA